MERIEQTITFKQVREGYKIEGDDLDICEPITNKGTIETILSNPYLDDESGTMYILERIDGKVRGRSMHFPSKLLAKGEILESTAGSGLFVEEESRKYALGLFLLMYSIQHNNNQYLLYAGLSKMVLPIYKKLKFSLFSTPLMWQPRNSRFVFQRVGLKDKFLNITTFAANIFLKTYVMLCKSICKRSGNKYFIERLLKIPHWVNDITLNNKYKYAEYHDHRWFQWVIDNGFSDDPRSSRRFYSVMSKEGEPMAFFMLKENHGSLPKRHIDDVCFGAIIEWGIMPGSNLTEYELTKLAMPYFSSDVDIVEFTSDNPEVISKMKKYGFIQHGEAHIGFKDLTKKLDNDSQDINNWRIRLGYSDVCFY